MRRHSFEIVLLAAAIVAGHFAMRGRPASDPAVAPPGDADWPGPSSGSPAYPWRSTAWVPEAALFHRFRPPAGFARTPVEPGSFAEWLRCLPLAPGRGVVRYPSGNPKPDQSSHAAVLDLDTGPGDLQQCADTILRLRAEWLWATGHTEELAFHFTSGDLCRFDDWRRGVRPRVAGNRVEWVRSGSPDGSRDSFLAWLRVVFTYAGTISIRREMEPVASWRDLEIGDVLVRAGSPGHAVLVVDLATNGDDRAVLLAQGYMPAQDPHVLAGELADWFEIPAGGSLEAAGWEFGEEDLRRF